MPKFGYRKMFADLDPYYPQPQDLNKLAALMSGRAAFPGIGFNSGTSADLPPQTNSASAAALIPAGYTYLGQFIIHDISFDEKSDRHNRDHLPWEIACPEQIANLRNLRKPQFDLETIYGHEEPLNEGEVPRAKLMLDHPLGLPLLKLGETEGEIGGGTARLSYPCDLPRLQTSVDAEIVDGRNDENLLIAQTQVSFIKFHNAMVVRLAEFYKDGAGRYQTKELFEKARDLTIRYYQKIILTDYLPKIIEKTVLDEVRQKAGSGELFYKPTEDHLFIPLEFAVGAFRFGHSMIRSEYDLNVKIGRTTLLSLMKFTGRGKMDSNIIVSRTRLPSIWIVDWNSFYQINRPNFDAAEPINTELVFDLLSLVPRVGTRHDLRPDSLAALDLYRGRRFGLPTGQDIAAQIPGAPVLRSDAIAQTIASRKIDKISNGEADLLKQELIQVFGEKTPLWYYILAEAERQATGRLGAVGSLIVAETFVQLLFYSEPSVLKRDLEGAERFLLTDDKFGMPDMLRFINDMNRQHSDLLYPFELYPQVTKRSFDEINPLGED